MLAEIILEDLDRILEEKGDLLETEEILDVMRQRGMSPECADVVSAGVSGNAVNAHVTFAHHPFNCATPG